MASLRLRRKKTEIKIQTNGFNVVMSIPHFPAVGLVTDRTGDRRPPAVITCELAHPSDWQDCYSKLDDYTLAVSSMLKQN